MHRTGHILMLHHSEGERMRRVAKWFRGGLLSEEKLVYVDVAGWGADSLAETLAARGLNVNVQLKTQQLEFVSLEEILALGQEGDLVTTALSAGYPGIRVAVRCDALAHLISRVDHVDLEHRLSRICRESPVSVLCQYDGRTTRGAALELALDAHPDWVYEADLSMRRRGHVIRIEGHLDALDGEVLFQSLERMSRGLATEDVLALDLRNVEALTPRAGRALVAGTKTFRDRGGLVRCGPPNGAPGELLRTLFVGSEPGFTMMWEQPTRR